MPRGFFTKSETLSSGVSVSRVPYCGACGLYKHCNTPKMQPTGKGRKRILLVTEYPTRRDDEQGRHLTGKAGLYIQNVFRRHGVDVLKDCIVTNAVICHSGKEPKSDIISHCRPNLVKTIEEYQPEIIIPMGFIAVKSLIGMLWKDKIKELGPWVGWQIPVQRMHKKELNAWVCPTYHPEFFLREAVLKKFPVYELFFEEHIEKAVSLEGRPYENLPDYEKQIEVITDVKQAASILRDMIRQGGPVAFDYECNMLKPDLDEARIVSAAVCWRGERTIAYPWYGDAVKASCELLFSKLPKIASNIKFEDRWTRRFFGRPVVNWVWDTMLGAHVHDCRPDITSIKFQSFINLGQDSYDDHIKKLLKSKGDKKTNQILREVDLRKLLIYNGLDSLLEYLVAVKQRKIMGHAAFK